MANSVTCYFRHLEALLKKAGITVTAQNRQQVDRVIHELAVLITRIAQLLGVKLKSVWLMMRKVLFYS